MTSGLTNGLTAEDYEEVLTDHRRLVRELDVALSGEEGAAKQASLCDLIGQAKQMREALRFYANNVNYLPNPNCQAQLYINIDGGEKARKALRCEYSADKKDA